MDESVQTRVGGRVRVRSGQYVITAIVVESCGDAWMVRNPKSGRVFKVRRIIEVLGDGEASPATIPASVGVPQMERPARELPKRLSLVDAAYEVLKAEGRPMNAAEMARLAVERGLWTAQGGKTPAQTLYARIFEEMRHARRPRFRKTSMCGLFELA